MKKEWPIKVLATVVVVGVALAVKFLFCAVPYWQSSEVYKKYKDVEGIRASYVKDYPVNDTLTVAVTLLETNDTGWERLMEDFRIPDALREIAEAATDKNKVWTRTVLKGHPEEKVSVATFTDGEWKYDMVAMDFTLHKIALFDLNNMEEYMAIHDYGYDYMTNKTNQFIKK
jgi:hypothetical protein